MMPENGWSTAAPLTHTTSHVAHRGDTLSTRDSTTEPGCGRTAAALPRCTSAVGRRCCESAAGCTRRATPARAEQTAPSASLTYVPGPASTSLLCRRRSPGHTTEDIEPAAQQTGPRHRHWPSLSRVKLAAARGAASLAQRGFALTASPDQALPERLVRGGAKVLLLGEGNFSYAAAFCRRHAGSDVRVIASSLESSSDARSLWGAGPALDELAELPGVDVLHGVDATALELSDLRGEAFDAVAFTFPHSGKKGRIQLNKTLLSTFAVSLQKAALLREPFGHAEVTLAAGQGGTPADGSKRRSFPGDSWQLALNVADGGFLVTDAEPFNHDGWTALGYRASGHYRGMGRLGGGTMDKQFHSTAAVVHCLIPEGRPGAVSRWPEVFELDASFWVGDDTWRTALVAHMVDATPDVAHAFTTAVCEISRRAVGQHLSSVAVVNLWQRPVDGNVSACLRFTYSAPELAMTHARARAMHEAVKECLQGAMRVTVRTRADVV